MTGWATQFRCPEPLNPPLQPDGGRCAPLPSAAERQYHELARIIAPP